MKWLVYLHYRLDTGECFYIGKGTEKRARAKDCRNNYWKKIVTKAGRKVVIAQYFELESDALAYEIDLIARIKPIANFSIGGESGFTGLTHSKAVKEKCRISTLKLRENPEWLERNLAAMKEAVAKPESRNKLKKARSEYFLKEENKLNMSIRQKEYIRNNPEANAERIRLSIEARQTPEYKLKASRVQGGKDFVVYRDSQFVAEVQIMNEFARSNNLHSSAIHRCLIGKQKEHKGFTFRYKEAA
jgi:hypothetical protein